MPIKPSSVDQLSRDRVAPSFPNTVEENVGLLQTVSLLERAIGVSSCGITITDMQDPAQPLIFVNTAFEFMTGYHRAEVIGKNCRFLQGDHRQQPALAELRTALKQGTDCSVILQNFRKDGTPFWNELTLSPIFDARGMLTHFIGIQTDITRRVQAEEEIRNINTTLERKVQERTLELHNAYDATLEGWGSALDIRDNETRGHTLRVTNMTLQLAQALGLNEEEKQHIRRGALLHDIGKIGIPDRVLLKPGQLNAEEWDIMKEHPVYAYQWLSPIKYLHPALAIPHSHHEKWDGSGYPCGLAGEDIPLAARLFAVVDVWDALLSDRPYRLAWPQDRVVEHIRSFAGTHFDPHIVEVFLKLVDIGPLAVCLP